MAEREQRVRPAIGPQKHGNNGLPMGRPGDRDHVWWWWMVGPQGLEP